MTQEKAAEAKEGSKGMVQSAQDKASETAQAAQAKASETAQAAQEKAEQAKEQTGSMLQQVRILNPKSFSFFEYVRIRMSLKSAV